MKNLLKDTTLETTQRIKGYIEEHGGECVVATPERILPEGTECVLVLGGDGTLIRAARDMHHYDVPLLGINMGTLGYLTEVELQNVEDALSRLCEGDIQVERRMMLAGTINDVREEVAFNDVVITRFGVLRVIHFKLYVNGELLNSYHADGMIVSTPTGSTAYNLSAGGPIVEPTASMIVVTPICSHALNTSSIVLSADDEIMIEIMPDREGNEQTVGVSFDGECNLELKTGDRVVIRKSQSETELLKLSDISFLERMRRKMKGN